MNTPHNDIGNTIIMPKMESSLTDKEISKKTSIHTHTYFNGNGKCYTSSL